MTEELKLYRVRDLVRIFQINRNQPKRWEKAGLLRGRKIGRITFYKQEDVHQLIEDSQNKGRA